MPSSSALKLELRPDAIQPSYSRAARRTQGPLPQAPMTSGGPPRTSGHGLIALPSTVSPLSRRFTVEAPSRSSLKRCAKSTPTASKSFCVEPAPMPATKRPPDSACSVMKRCASSTGERSGS